MKLGWDLRIGLNRYLTSWKSADDPSPGEFSYGYDLEGLPQAVMRKGSDKKYRSGIWNGLQFNGALVKNSIFNADFIANSEDVYFEFGLYEQLTMVVLNYTGTVQHVIWNNKNLEWVVFYTLPANPCESYGNCGPNAICTVTDSRICSCLNGYVPKSPQDWNTLAWDGGCVLKYPLNCSDGEGFVAFNGVILPDLLRFWKNTSMTLEECELECLKNCSCTAYANSATTGGGSGCLLWYGNLIDIRRSSSSGDHTLYIRATAADLDSRSDSKKKKKLALVIIPVSIASLLLLLASCVIWKRIKQTQDNTKSNSLAWRKRFDVIVGIARGLLYLHRDSRLRIIHRDLKASNVLLDNELNSKISDFGIARAFGGDQISEKTRRVIGTYGYMSPEYIMHGLFSMKSDVFSFGVLVLEIVSGQRNIKFRHPNHTLNLLGHAWKLWIEGKVVELVDEKMGTSTSMSEVIKCIQIGLSCVQKRPEDRPTMSSVVSMLDNENAMLPQPKQPGFYTESSDEVELASITRSHYASNEISHSFLLGR